MVQTIGSAGESVAAGAIFTLPALFLWAEEGKIAFPSILSIALIALFGGILEYASWYRFVRLLSLKSTEHFLSQRELLVQKFFWPEKKVDLRLVQYSQDLVSQPFPNSLQTERSSSQVRIGHAFKNYSGAQIGMQVLPALGGVGYICGPKISSYMFAGGTLSWFVLMPMIALFGGDATIFPASVTVNELLTMPGGGIRPLCGVTTSNTSEQELLQLVVSSV